MPSDGDGISVRLHHGERRRAAPAVLQYAQGAGIAGGAPMMGDQPGRVVVTGKQMGHALGQAVQQGGEVGGLQQAKGVAWRAVGEKAPAFPNIGGKVEGQARQLGMRPALHVPVVACVFRRIGMRETGLMVAQEHESVSLPEQAQYLPGLGAEVDLIAQGDHPLAAFRLGGGQHGAQGGQVAVNIGENQCAHGGLLKKGKARRKVRPCFCSCIPGGACCPCSRW